MAFYAKGLQDALEAVTGVAAATTGTLKGAFMSTAYTIDKETHQFWSDISASIASGTTVATLSNITVTVDTVNNRVEIDFDDVTEDPVSANTDQFVIFMDTGTPTTSPLIAHGTISPTLNPVGGTLTLTVNAEGFVGVNY